MNNEFVVYPAVSFYHHSYAGALEFRNIIVNVSTEYQTPFPTRRICQIFIRLEGFDPIGQVESHV